MIEFRVPNLVFGRHPERKGVENPNAEIEVHLESDIDAVQQAVATFLQNSSEGARQTLLTELERFHNKIDLGDAYPASVVGSPIFGSAP